MRKMKRKLYGRFWVEDGYIMTKSGKWGLPYGSIGCLPGRLG